MAEAALHRAIHRANELLESGRVAEALSALAEVGEQASHQGDWPLAIRAHRIAAEILHSMGELGPAFSHAAEGLYLCVEHVPGDTLTSLGQVMAFIEQAVAERRYHIAQEVGTGLSQVLGTLQPSPEGEPWRDLALETATVIALVGESLGDEESPAFVEAVTQAALVDRATQGHLNLNQWVHSTAIRVGKNG